MILQKFKIVIGLLKNEGKMLSVAVRSARPKVQKLAVFEPNSVLHRET